MYLNWQVDGVVVVVTGIRRWFLHKGTYVCTVLQHTRVDIHMDGAVVVVTQNRLSLYRCTVNTLESATSHLRMKLEYGG